MCQKTIIYSKITSPPLALIDVLIHSKIVGRFIVINCRVGASCSNGKMSAQSVAGIQLIYERFQPITSANLTKITVFSRATTYREISLFVASTQACWGSIFLALDMTFRQGVEEHSPPLSLLIIFIQLIVIMYYWLPSVTHPARLPIHVTQFKMFYLCYCVCLMRQIKHALSESI